MFSVKKLRNVLITVAILLAAFSCTFAADNTAVEAKPISFEARARLEIPEIEEATTFSDRVIDFFSIQSLSCVGNVRVKCKDVKNKLEANGALLLWSFSMRELGFPVGKSASLAEKILKDDPWIEEAAVEVKPFSRSAQVKIQEAVPWFVTELRGQTWVVSRRGRLLQELRSIQDSDLTVEVSQLPRVRGIEVHGADSVMREAERIHMLMKLLGSLESAGKIPFDIESYELVEDGSLAILPLNASLPTVFIKADTAEEARSKLRLLEEVLKDSSSERLAKVDLRVPGRAIVSKEAVSKEPVTAPKK